MKPDRIAAPSFCYEPPRASRLFDRLAMFGEFAVWAPALALCGAFLYAAMVVAKILVTP